MVFEYRASAMASGWVGRTPSPLWTLTGFPALWFSTKCPQTPTLWILGYLSAYDPNHGDSPPYYLFRMFGYKRPIIYIIYSNLKLSSYRHLDETFFSRLGYCLGRLAGQLTPKSIPKVFPVKPSTRCI